MKIKNAGTIEDNEKKILPKKEKKLLQKNEKLNKISNIDMTQKDKNLK